MSWWLLGLLFDVGAAAPQLSTGSWVVGQAATLSVDDALPGTRVYFGGSLTGPGPGPCPAPLGGVCLGIVAPTLLGSAIADGDGRAAISVTVPALLADRPVALQAGHGGPSPAVTDVLQVRGWVDPPTTSVVPTISSARLVNPERGFYQYVDVVGATDLSWAAAEGSALVFSYVRLDDHRDGDLPASLLADVETGLQALRDAGLKIVLRFAYNFGPWPDSEPDASEAWVLAHIAQLTPLLQANSDVIAVVQAGFIGAWGEWHSSTNGLLDDPATKYTILEALLTAVPPDRKVQLRYPPYKDEGYGGPLDVSVAHDGSSASRVGHHNDCFLASDTDYGTYPDGERATWLTWLGQENQYVPMGGETCDVYPALTDCAPAMVELEQLRFTYINDDYHPDVLQGWRDGGCYDTIDDHLGYRLAATAVSWPEVVRPGGTIPLSVTLRNDGWAAPINPRPVRVVLVGPQTLTVDLPLDPRWWMPGETVDLDLRLQLPGDLAEGAWELGLWLPDADARLRDDARYSIQLANQGTWRSGWNALGAVSVQADGPGSADADAPAFVLIDGP